MKSLSKTSLTFLMIVLILVSGCIRNEKAQAPGTEITPASELNILFSDNFTEYDLGSDASPIWSSVDMTTVSVTEDTQSDGKVGKVLEVKPKNMPPIPGFISAGNYEWKDYVLQVLTKQGSQYGDNIPALIFRMQNNGQKYYLLTYNEYGASFGTVRLYKVVGKTGTKIGEKRIPLENLNDGKWHKITVMVNENKIYANIDGYVIFDGIIDDDPAMRNGKIGLSMSDNIGLIHYDNVLVLELNDAAKNFYEKTLLKRV